MKTSTELFDIQEKIIKEIKEIDEIFDHDYPNDRNINLSAIFERLPDIEKYKIEECISKWDKILEFNLQNGNITISKECFM